MSALLLQTLDLGVALDPIIELLDLGNRNRIAVLALFRPDQCHAGVRPPPSGEIHLDRLSWPDAERLRARPPGFWRRAGQVSALSRRRVRCLLSVYLGT